MRVDLVHVVLAALRLLLASTGLAVHRVEEPVSLLLVSLALVVALEVIVLANGLLRLLRTLQVLVLQLSQVHLRLFHKLHALLALGASLLRLSPVAQNGLLKRLHHVPPHVLDQLHLLETLVQRFVLY